MDSTISQVNIASDPQTCMKAFTDPGMLKAWWGVEKSLINTYPGGLYTLGWDVSESGFRYVVSGIVKAYTEGALLEIENYIYMHPNVSILGPMGLKIEAGSIPEGTHLQVIQSGYQEGPEWEWYRESVEEAWPQVLTYLKKYLEGLET